MLLGVKVPAHSQRGTLSGTYKSMWGSGDYWSLELATGNFFPMPALYDEYLAYQRSGTHLVFYPIPDMAHGLWSGLAVEHFDEKSYPFSSYPYPRNASGRQSPASLWR